MMIAASPMSFQGANEVREPGIHNPELWLWIPALAALRLGRNDGEEDCA